MKNSLVIAALVLVAGPIIIDPVATAAGREKTQCRSEHVADAGYELTVAANQKTAVLQEQTIAGPRLVADLDCERLHNRTIPDATQNYLVCRDARAPNSGLVVRLMAGGFIPTHFATVSFHGQQNQFGRLNCR